jgi:integrase
MPTVDLSNRTAAGLMCPPDKKEVIYWSGDLPGFGLRCRAGGARRWFVQYRTKTGETRKHALGDPSTVGLAQARREAARLLAAARLGGDPSGEAKEARAAISFAGLVERFLAHQRKRVRSTTYTELARHLENHAKPLHGKRAEAVGQRDIVGLLQAVTERGPIIANRVRSSISSTYAWGMKAGLVTSNPVVATFKPAEERARDRVLSDDELDIIWRCTGAATDHDRIVRLLMLTGARREEVAGIRWSKITRSDDGTAVWVLRAERSKNRRAHELILPPMIAGLLPAPRYERGGVLRDLLFGEGRGPFSGWSQCKTRLDKRIAEANGGTIAPWVLHDLRRTFVTRLNDVGVEPHIIEALVNHVGGVARAGVAGIYNRSAYGAQKSAALVLWTEYVGQLTSAGRRGGGRTARKDGSDVPIS